MKSENYLWEIETIGLQAQVSNWDGVQEALVTMVAVCMGVEETGMQNKAQGCIQSASKLGPRPGMHADTAEQLRSISMHKIEIDWKKRGLRPSGPGPPARWPADKVVGGGMIVT